MGHGYIETEQEFHVDREALPRTTKTITGEDYFAFFHQCFGFTNIPVLAPFAQERCRFQKYFVGGEGGWDH